MSNRFIKYYSVCLILVIALAGVLFYNLLPDPIKPVSVKEDPLLWFPPEISSIINNPEADLIIYGRDLIQHTSKYFGPRGKIAAISNGMNCGSCHIDAGIHNNAFCLSAVAANYPKFRNRSGRMESIEFRINECFARSLDGKMIDSAGKEMKAMVAYLKWLGKDVPKNISPKGSGIPQIEILDRAADPNVGRNIYSEKCSRCHGAGGQGLLNSDSTEFVYPPLWGSNSYNVSAGLFRISSIAGFIKYNMPYKTNQAEPQLTDEEAWDLAAFINSQKRPVKFFKQDWPKLETKPYDFPFGPYTDSFSELQHKYGPFAVIKNKKQGS